LYMGMNNRCSAVFCTKTGFCYGYKWFNIIELSVTMATKIGDN